METGIPMSVVVNDDVDQQTLDNLNANVLTRGGQADCLRLYILGYIARGGFASVWIRTSRAVNLVRQAWGLVSDWI